MSNTNANTHLTLEERRIILTGITALNLRRQVGRKLPKKKAVLYNWRVKSFPHFFGNSSDTPLFKDGK